MSITLTREMFSRLSESSRYDVLRVFGEITVEKPLVVSSAFESASLTFGPPLVLPDYSKRNLLSGSKNERNPRIGCLNDPWADLPDAVLSAILDEVEANLAKAVPVAMPVAVPVPVAMPVPVPVPVAVSEQIPSVVPSDKAKIRIAQSFPIAKPSDLYSLAPLKHIHKICEEIDAGLFVSNTNSAVWTRGGNHHHQNWDVKKVVMIVNQLQPATSLQINYALPTMDRYRVTAILRELRKQGIVIVS